MPYEHIEELQARKSEKVALFLSAENIGGLLALGLPTYALTAALEPGWLRLPLLLLSAALGVAATADVGGMAFYERALWLVRGRLRRLAHGGRVQPAALPGSVAETRVRPLAHGGPVRPAPLSGGGRADH